MCVFYKDRNRNILFRISFVFIHLFTYLIYSSYVGHISTIHYPIPYY